MFKVNKTVIFSVGTITILIKSSFEQKGISANLFLHLVLVAPRISCENSVQEVRTLHVDIVMLPVLQATPHVTKTVMI